MKRNPTDVPGCYSYLLADGSLRYGAVVDVRGAWGKERLQRRKEGFARLRDAKEWRTGELAGVLAGKTSVGGSRTFGWWVQEWIELRSGEWEHSTLQIHRAHMKKFAALFWTPLIKLTPADFESVLVRLRGTHKASTVGLVRSRLVSCLNGAVNLGLLARNPAKGTTPIRPDRGRREVWDATRVKALLDGTRDDAEWHIIWRLMAETWMRVGEACGLRWGDVDLSGAELRVERTMRREVGGWVVGDTAKTKGAVRVIPLGDGLVAELRAWRDQQRFTGGGERVVGVTPKQVLVEMARTCERLELPVVGPHMLRHAGATMAIRAGIEPRLVMQRLGHTNIAFTLQTYVHPNEDDHRQAADRLAKLLG
jgi:integrase